MNGKTIVHVSQNVGYACDLYTATRVNKGMKRGLSQCTYGYTLVQVSQNVGSGTEL